MSSESLAELSNLVKGLAEKKERLEAFSQSRDDAIYAKLTMLDLHRTGYPQGLERLNQEIETVKWCRGKLIKRNWNYLKRR